jgi:phosphatidate cytidylyltransferase
MTPLERLDPLLVRAFGGVLGLLVVASLVGWILARRARTDAGRATIANMNARTRAWWVMAAVVAAALLFGRIASTVLFGLLSWLALREFITITPTRRGDHATLFWAFFVITPLQYVLVAIDWYGLWSILIPVYAFLFVPIRSALAGDTERFLERTAKIQWGLMVCVYCVSHAPALVALELPGFAGHGARLLLFLIVVVQLSDVFQYVFGKLFGRHAIAPHVSPNKTWEGFLGGAVTATALGAGLWWLTPYTPRQAAGMAFLVVLMGFAGGLTMSAIKRDRGIKDYGALIEGHGGILDRIDSLCFAAPVLFHVTRYFWSE